MTVSLPSGFGDKTGLNDGRTRMAMIMGLMLGGQGWARRWEGNDGCNGFDDGRAMLAATLGDEAGLNDGRMRMATIIGLTLGG